MANWYKEIFRRDDPELRSEVGRLVAASRRAPAALEAGAVVEFVREGHLRCGVVRGAPRGRAVTLLAVDGHELTVRRDKIAHVSGERIAPERRQAALRELTLVDGRRDWASRSVDVGTLWAVAREERGDDGEWSMDELAGLYFGKGLEAGDRAVLLRALWRGEWFARRGKAWRPLAEEVVAARQDERRRRCRGERQTDALSAWLRDVMDGCPGGPRPPGAEGAVELLEEVALYGSDAERAGEAARLMKGAHLHGPGAALDVLVELGHWDEDENLDLRRCGAPLAFGEAATEASEVAACGQAAWPAAARRSRRVWLGRPVGLVPQGEACFLAASSQRWPGGYRVAVYVPALSLLVPAGSHVDEEARSRGVALHLPDRTLPLIPQPLLEMASLTEEAVVPCLVVEAVLGRDLKVRRCRLRLRRVCPRTLWRDGEGRSTGGGAAGSGGGLLLDLARGLRHRRLGSGAVIFPPRPRPAKDGGPQLLPPPGEIAAAAEEYVLLASEACGVLCRSEGIPAVYRVQPEPATAAPRGRVLDPVGARLQARALPRTVLQVEAGRWAGMGLEVSVPAAAPAESYLDLVMQRQLLARLGCGPQLTEADLHRAVEDTAAAREAAVEVGRSARRYWLLKVLEERVGERLPALVLERAGLGYVVELEGVGCRDYVPVRGELIARAGDRIAVLVEQVSARRDLLRLSLAGAAGESG